MKTQTNIIVNLQVEGIHHWPGAGAHDINVDFLMFPHRHVFHVKCKKRVTHDNREVEIILFKREIEQFFKRCYGEPAAFDEMSCEQIAHELVEVYDLESAEVTEDNENGAEVIRVRDLKNPW